MKSKKPKTPPQRQDKNFNTIASKFTRQIYQTGKGMIRQHILCRDLASFIEHDTPLRILDVGGGQGQMAMKFLAQGHHVVINDIASEMLARAEQDIHQQNLPGTYEFVCAPLQTLPDVLAEQKPFDLVLCHAVLEWIVDAQAALQILKQLSELGHNSKHTDYAPISLMFFNKDALRFGNILYGNFDYVRRDLKVRQTVAMSPKWPLTIDQVKQWCDALSLDIDIHSGVRCFHDFVVNRTQQKDWFEDLLDMELRFAHLEPYRALGKYQHFLLKNALSSLSNTCVNHE